MKILLDPIYTNDPAHCASNAKMRKIVDYLLERRPDIYFYWLTPIWASEEELAWYPEHERVRYIEYPHSKDRMREYMRIDREYEDLINFQGTLWDFDIIVTNRTSLTTLIKMMANKPSRDNLAWSKRVFLIEDMPVMKFKLHVALSHNYASSLQTVTGYLAADDIIISAFWEKKYILAEAKEYMSASSLKHIRDTMVESSAALVDKVKFKKKKDIVKRLEGKRPFTMAFVGRMTHNMKAEEIFDIMGKHWIFRGGEKNNIECIATTQSLGAGRVDVPDFVDIRRLPREEFWETIQERTDVFLFLTNEVDYPMSLIECLLLGCPGIVYKCRWSIPTLGEDYPFFVGNVTEAYGMIKDFYEDYPKMYKKFVTWSKNKFEPMMLERNKTYPPYLVEQATERYAQDFDAYTEKTDSAYQNEITNLLVDYADENDGELRVFEAIRALDKEGKLRGIATKTTKKVQEGMRRTWGIDWNLFRLGLQMHGFVDASTETGHMIRVENKK